MRKEILFNENWLFEMPGVESVKVNLPHTWNGDDGQDGGDDYVRTKCNYTKEFAKPELKEGDRVLFEFKGVNSESEVIINGTKVFYHEGGYSTFIVDVTDYLKDNNVLVVTANNAKNEHVYPQLADFTFYGGIYRDVNMIILPKNHFEFLEFSSPALKVTPTVVDGHDGKLLVEAKVSGEGTTNVELLDADAKVVATGDINKEINLKDVHLWNGIEDPYLYTVKATLTVNGEVVDEVSTHIGFRYFKVDPKKGFFLNGKSYPVRGVCRHQDRPHKGNAISKADHEEDIALIKEIGANGLRLAHYQHDQYFYDLCDKNGFLVWAEIPYISRYMKDGDQNAISQMNELVHQNYNHPSIVCWGLSNEITIKKINADTRANHRELNELCHKADPTRFTAVACYSVMSIFNRIAHISDVASYNLYWGWYVPITKVTGLVLDMWHLFYPKSPIGLSEYGAEARELYHSSHPRRGDNTEEYQALYHERMIRIINKRPYLWATHVWNMFDFAADVRNQGGQPGMNHKGLVSFDRKTKKDAFYAYKADWSKEPFVHVCGKHYVNRCENVSKIKVYSNQSEVSLYQNGKLIATKQGKEVFNFKVKLEDENNIEVRSGDLKDTLFIKKVSTPDLSYNMKKGGTNKSWEK